MRAATGLAMLLSVALAPGMSVAAATPKVVVVPAQGKGGPNIKSQIGSLIEKALKQSATLISFDKYSKAAKTAGVRAKSITGPEAVIPASRGVGATHVLIVESIGDKVGEGKKKKTAYFASVTLVDAVTGETLLSKHYPLDNKRLSNAVASAIVGDVVPRFEPKIAPPAPAPEPPPPPPALAAPTPPPPAVVPPPQSPAPAAPRPAPQPETFGSEPAFGTAPAEGAPVPPEAPPPAAAVSDSGEPPPPAEKRRDTWRPGFRGYLGELGFFRDGRLTTANAADQPPCYCQRPGVPAPLFSRTQLQLELYPFAFGGLGDWWEGIGAHGEASVGVVHTNLGGGQMATSAVGGASGGLTYRLVLWDSLSATDIQFRGGFSVFSFPLHGAQFPGTGYRSPYGGLVVTQPITDRLAVFLGGSYMFRVIGYGGTAALGVQTVAGWGLHGEVGVRATFLEILDLKATVLLDQYTVPFDARSVTKLVGANPQYSGVTLKDTMWGGLLSIGTSL